MRIGILIQMQEDIYRRIAWAADLGFRSAQLSVWNMALYNEEMAAEIERACADFHFEITAVWCGWSGPRTFEHPYRYATLGLVPSSMRTARTDEILRGAAFARRLGVNDIVTHLGFVPDSPFDPDHIGVVMAIRHICRQIEPYGQRFLFETGELLPGTLLDLIKAAEVDNVGINFDPANFLINARANPSDAMDRLAFMTCGFHAKDGVYPQGFESKGKEVQIGQGQVDFAALFRKMKSAGFDCDITIEREIPDGSERDRQILEEKIYLEEILKSLE